MNFATFDLNLLRVLDALLTEGSTIRAGGKLGLSQSAVSNALSRLRHALNDPLFIRQGNRLVPTDFASSVKNGIREELNRLETLLTQPNTFDPSKAVANFKIATSDFFAELLMPQLADLLNKTAPNIRAQMIDLTPGNHLGSLENEGADLVLIPDMPLPDWISREPLFFSPFLTIARRKNPYLEHLPEGSVIPMDLFCDLSHVLFSPEGKVAAMGDDALAKVGRKRHVAMTLPIFSGVCRAVSESNLIALVPAQLARKIAPDLGLRLFQPPMHIEPALIVAVWHKRSDDNLIASWVREQIFNLVRPLGHS